MNESGFLLEMFFRGWGEFIVMQISFLCYYCFGTKFQGEANVVFFWVEGGKLPQGLPPVEESQD